LLPKAFRNNKSTNRLTQVFFNLTIYESDAMLFKKFAVAAAVATTLAFAGCSKKEEAPATDATAAASEAVAAASEATTAVEAAASDVAIDVAASDVAIDVAASDVAASDVAPSEASAAQ
jgi:PBP1b-binding outer membrane lipoprotein LpoB